MEKVLKGEAMGMVDDEGVVVDEVSRTMTDHVRKN